MDFEASLVWAGKARPYGRTRRYPVQQALRDELPKI